MKLKNYLLIGLFSLLLIPSFSNAELLEYISPFTISNKAGNNYYSQSIDISSNLSFQTTSNNISVDNVLYLRSDGSTNGSRPYVLAFGWKNGKLYSLYNVYDSRGDHFSGQGFIQNFGICSSVGCDLEDSFDSFKSFISNNNIIGLALENGATVGSNQGLVGSTAYPSTLCFITSNSSTPYACFTKGSVSSWGATLLDSLNYSVSDWKDISSFNGFFDNTPINNTTYYYSTGSCPSVGQLKASSNLTPAVCYAGYDGDLIYTAGENTTIQAGSGLTLFQTYELFSGNMNIQDWYDTYRTYYNNISFNPYPFYNKPKALLGLMVARQTAGLTHGYKGSYIILNYCYYVLNNIPDNSSTCVGSSVSTQYPGITLTEQDNQDLIDSINEDYNVHQPGSGSIFLDPSQGLGGGGSSWGDDQCSGIPCLFEKFYQMFTSSRINDVDFSQGGQGILPGYIALAFVIVVLFYVFKR